MSGHSAESDALIEATMYRSHAMTARLVTARKSHPCDYSRDASWGRACRTIRPGEQYVRVTVFPGHDFVETKRPTTGACCLACAEGYTGLDMLARVTSPAKSDEPMGEQGWVTHRWIEDGDQRAARHTSGEECPGCVLPPAEGRDS